MVVTNFSHACSLLFTWYSLVVQATCMIYVCKFEWVKLWQVVPDLPNSPKFSPPPFCTIQYPLLLVSNIYYVAYSATLLEEI